MADCLPLIPQSTASPGRRQTQHGATTDYRAGKITPLITQQPIHTHRYLQPPTLVDFGEGLWQMGREMLHATSQNKMHGNIEFRGHGDIRAGGHDTLYSQTSRLQSDIGFLLVPIFPFLRAVNLTH